MMRDGSLVFPLPLSPAGRRSRDVSGLDERDERARSSGRVPSNNSPVLAVPQLGLRDNLIRCELLKNEDLYTYREHFRYARSAPSQIGISICSPLSICKREIPLRVVA